MRSDYYQKLALYKVFTYLLVCVECTLMHNIKQEMGIIKQQRTL